MATLTETLGKDYQHSVFAMDGRFDAEAVLPDGIDYRRIEAPVEKGGFISLKNIRSFRGLLAGHDLLLTSNWGAIEWLLANRGRRAVPHVHFEDGFGPDERPDAQNKKRVLVRRLAFRKRGLEFVAPSRVLEDVFRETWRVDPARVHLIANGVDCERFGKIDAPSRPLTIGTVAALRREKRLDRLIGCFSEMNDATARLLIVGDGSERVALEAQAAPLGDRVRFVGEQSDVAPFLAEMDIYALSSDTEQMPISLVEGMATSLPVVATDVGDVAAMVGEHNREFVVPLGTASALTEALNALAENRALRGKLGAENRDKAVAEYGVAVMTARYDSLFRRMVMSR